MRQVLVLTGPNHGFDKCAPIVAEALSTLPDTMVTLSDDKGLLANGLARFGAIAMGTGFNRRQRQADGTIANLPELSDEQAAGLYAFVRGGGGFVGVHGTGWWIGGEAMLLVGGHANWHPAGLEFRVRIDDAAHPAMSGLSDFSVTDEIYMSAWDPAIRILATATWADRQHPVAWTNQYGQGRVFFTALGHGPSTFQHPSVQTMLANATAWVSR